MRAGLLYSQVGTNGDFAPVIDQIVAADNLGFDTVWVEDRPFEAQGLGAVAITLAALAKRTRAIRLGTFRNLVFDHPARTAEDFAMVDLISGGRLNFGVTTGSSREAFRTYKVPFAERQERFREALEFIVTAWNADEFSYGGHHYQFPSHTAAGTGVRRKRLGREPYLPQWERGPELPDYLTVTPKPLQQPRPPVWILADAPELVTFAAERGHSVVLPEGNLGRLGAAADAYESTLTRAGRERNEVELAVIVNVPVQDNRTPADTIERLHKVHDATGLNQVIWRAPYPAVPHEAMMAALSQFAGEVQPMLQA
jgi:alkanesulfonate monooxygenase SsuD/methylene tetrahydromethanopterin reductase-like flavin-dependent oxidoreductase (luciferase family)